MKFKQFGSHYVLRLIKGEEVMTTLKAFCKQEGILLGKITALGGVEKVTVGSLQKSTMQYAKRTFDEVMEITGFFGTITSQEGEPYLHIHMTLGDPEMRTFGGHFFEGYVFPTMEVFIDVIEDGHVGRAQDPDTGLILMDLA